MQEANFEQAVSSYHYHSNGPEEACIKVFQMDNQKSIFTNANVNLPLLEIRSTPVRSGH